MGVQGDPLTLDCNPTGQPSPGVTWFRGPVQIQGDSRVSVSAEGRLVFRTLFSTDAGTYSCTAANEVGSASDTTQLRVLGTSDS